MLVTAKPRGPSVTLTALVYITLGALLVVWSPIWYARLAHAPTDPQDVKWYWCYGFMLSGVVLLTIGLAIGAIRRAAARRASGTEVPAASAIAGAPPVAPLIVTSPPVVASAVSERRTA
jgi:hypothetical protein